MEQNRSLQIANLEVQIGFLQVEEKRLQSIISSTLTVPEYRAKAQAQLTQTLEKLEAAAREIARLKVEP
jgi:dihydroneopterin aldolase